MASAFPSIVTVELRDAVIKIATEAGAAIMDVYGDAFDVEYKSDASPLTQADLRAHKIIVEQLAALTPQWPILSEESAEVPYSIRSQWRTYWLVDPLDGTKEFVSRNGEFTVNIALIHEHLPVLGVVYVPASQVLYCGGENLGAHRQRAASSLEPIHVSKQLSSPLRVVGSRSHGSPMLDRYLKKINAHELVSMGSSLKFCVIAEGGADIYPRLGPTSEWDTAAAQAVVEAAGGSVCKLNGERLRYNTRADLLNPHFLVFANHSNDWLEAAKGLF